MTRHGFPAATTPGGISPFTTLPAPMTDPSPMVEPLRTIDRAPMKTSSPMTTRSVSFGWGGAAYRRGIASISWKSVSATRTSAPNSTRSPTDTCVAAQIVVPLSPTSAPISIRAPSRSARRMTGRPTPSAVEAGREMTMQRSPSVIDDPAASSTIGRPMIRTARPSVTPRARIVARQTRPSPVSFQARHAREARRRGLWALDPGVISTGRPSDGREG